MPHLVVNNPLRSSDRNECRATVKKALEEHAEDFYYWQNKDFAFADVAKVVHTSLHLLRHDLRSSSVLKDTEENLTRGGDIPIWQPCSEALAGDFARSISEFLAAVSFDLELAPLAIHVPGMQEVTQSSLQEFLDTDLEVLQMAVREMSDAFSNGLKPDAIDALQAKWREFVSEVQHTLDDLEEARPEREPRTIYRTDQRNSCGREIEATAETLAVLHRRLQELQSSTDASPVLEKRLQQRIAELEESMDYCRKRLARLDLKSDTVVAFPTPDRC